MSKNDWVTAWQRFWNIRDSTPFELTPFDADELIDVIERADLCQRYVCVFDDLCDVSGVRLYERVEAVYVIVEETLETNWHHDHLGNILAPDAKPFELYEQASSHIIRAAVPRMWYDILRMQLYLGCSLTRINC